MEESEVSP